MKFTVNFILNFSHKYSTRRKKIKIESCSTDILMSECNNWHAGTVCYDHMKFKWYDKKSHQSQN